MLIIPFSPFSRGEGGPKGRMRGSSEGGYFQPFL
jgi:hypothetical protein